MGFDRIKPPERRLLERTDADPDGREALYTAHGRARSGPFPAGTAVTVECERCGAVSRLEPKEALRALLPLALFAPWRNHPVFAICPAGRHRAWLRPRLDT